MWSGSVKLGLTTFPISIAKAWSDEREQGIRQVCTCHDTPIDRTERCAETGEAAEGKAYAVELPSGKFRRLSDSEYAKIEDDSSSDELEVLDFQPMYELPLDYSTGTYYVRYSPPKPKSTTGLDVMATFVKALSDDHAAVVMWKRSASHKLCALHVGEGGVLLLRQLPLDSEIRQPDSMEKRHVDVEVPEAAVAMFRQLFELTASDEFDHTTYTNEAKELRSAAVEKILAEDDGEQKQEKGDEKKGGEHVPDLMASLRASMDQAKVTKGDGEKPKPRKAKKA
jgi:non-homologous end joining protein Ku